MEPTGHSIVDLLTEGEQESSYRSRPDLYINAPLSEAFKRATESGEVKAPAEGDEFYGEKDPRWAIKHEKPEHRAMLFMRARGASIQDIAAAFGSTPAWVSNILRQPWARARLANEVNTAGRDDLSNLIETAAKDSLAKLIELRDNDKTPANVVADNCKYLVDRFLGKPKQSIKTELTGDPSKMSDVQLAQIAATGVTSTATAAPQGTGA